MECVYMPLLVYVLEEVFQQKLDLRQGLCHTAAALCVISKAGCRRLEGMHSVLLLRGHMAAS